MKHLRNSLYLGILLLTLLMACGPATPTVTPIPTVTPTSPGLVNSGPTFFPNVLVTVVPPKLACKPPALSITKVNSFCANKTAGLGGATWNQSPSVNDPSVAKEAAFINNFSENPDCTDDNNNKITCSGPQNTKITYQFCTSCGASNSVEPQEYDAVYGPNVCSKGYVKSNGACAPADPNKPYYAMCPSGSHYDNALQNCADDMTNNLASPCPAGYPYYLPNLRLCLANARFIVFNCQSFTIPLGGCLVLPKPKNSDSAVPAQPNPVIPPPPCTHC